MALGGKRPGAGRKKGTKASHTIQAEQARAYLINRIATELEPIVTGQIEMAKGINYVGKIGKKKAVIYTKLPDSYTAKYLLDQAAGRAKETLEVNAPPEVTPEDREKANQAITAFLHGRRNNPKK